MENIEYTEWVVITEDNAVLSDHTFYNKHVLSTNFIHPVNFRYKGYEMAHKFKTPEEAEKFIRDRNWQKVIPTYSILPAKEVFKPIT